MMGKIIGVVCSLLSASIFVLFANVGKHHKQPISFWSGDTSLDIKDVKGYNQEMSRLFKGYGVIFLLIGMVYLLQSVIGCVLLCLHWILGLYVVYRKYKKLLKVYA